MGRAAGTCRHQRGGQIDAITGKAELAEVTAQREHVTRSTVRRQRLTGGEMLFIHRHQRTVVLLTDQECHRQLSGSRQAGQQTRQCSHSCFAADDHGASLTVIADGGATGIRRQQRQTGGRRATHGG